MKESYYRYNSVLYSESRIYIFETEYAVLSHTPKGVWIEEYPGKKRFVLKNAKKKFACATQKEALESFRARKRRQIKILEHQLKIAKAALEAKPGESFIYFLGEK